MSALPTSLAAPLGPLRALRLASLGEGATLLLLVLIAVPLKRLAGMPEAVSIMGPIHGAAFLLYLAVVFKNLSARHINQQDTSLLVLVAFIPLGAFFLGGWFRRKAALLSPPAASS
jgi:integral membrane protein